MQDCCRNYSVHLRNPVLRPNNAGQSRGAEHMHTMKIYLLCWKKLENQYHMLNIVDHSDFLVTKTKTKMIAFS